MDTQINSRNGPPEAAVQPRPPSLVDPQVRRCPFNFYSDLRDHAPVAIMPGTDFYFVANFELANTVLMDTENYSNAFPAGETSFVNYLPEADKLLAEKGYGRRVPTEVVPENWTGS